ncbi:MAG TPA: hypothetical protein VLA56_03285 [Pseudomonadales bacterium]|nr:hypothetical protein [Pseudomonadales bacterium]
MIDTRVILVDGMPASGRTRLAQRISIQLGAAAIDHELCHAAGRGHPLRRDWDPAAYADAGSFMDTLVLQWENFATRAAMEDGVWLFDAALLDAPGALLDAGVIDADTAEALAERLMATLAPLTPVLLCLWRRADDAPDAQRLTDAVFGRLTEHRVLLNTQRASGDELLDDALAFLGLKRHELTLAAPLSARLAGRYGASEAGTDGPLLALRERDGGLVVDGIDAEPAAGVELLPAADGRLLVTGRDLTLHPNLAPAGDVRGLLVRTDDPRFAHLPDFLPRLPD